MSASARCQVASQGATYKTAIMANTTKLRTEASAAADIGLMAFSLTALIATRRSVFPKPGKRVRSCRAPFGRKDRRAFQSPLVSLLHRVRETGRYVKGICLRALAAI